MKMFSSGFTVADFTDVIDIRDGLNPAFRKLFFALNAKLQDNKFINSSRILKDIVGEENDFEPLYDLLVNTTWPRVDLPFVYGKGNFGFPPANSDFSELKLTEYGKTVIGSAFDNEFDLPFVSSIPYVFVNGTLGFSEGKTKIPTHNSAEVIEAMIALIRNPDLETEDLLEFIKGPDLLIGGAIENPEELCSIYENGYGTVNVIVTSENFNWEWFEAVGDYCTWYNLKFRKVYKKEAFRIEIPYYAFMNDGEKNELISLKNILKKHLAYYRSCKSELSDDDLCEELALFKEQSRCRITYEKF